MEDPNGYCERIARYAAIAERRRTTSDTLRVIGRDFGVSPERVRQICAKADRYALMDSYRAERWRAAGKTPVVYIKVSCPDDDRWMPRVKPRP